LNATQRSSFFIRIVVDWDDHSEDIDMYNDKTNEKLVIIRAGHSNGIKVNANNDEKLLLIARFRLGSGSKWIRPNEAKALNWNFDRQMRQIRLAQCLEIAL
jgi:hypothetical protein